MTKEVEFEHEGMRMYCDSAIFNEKENRFRSFGNIHIVQHDSLHVWGDELYYEGETKVAEMFGEKVVMKDNNITLNTTYLILERIPNTVSYTRWADIYDNKSTLRSRQATYDMTTKDIYFVRKVEINSEKTKVYSDTMVYNTNNYIATFYCPTNIITTDSTFIYTELG
ncbi:MAG: OstA-like protein, partial [Bacteroidaceae bacterium]|nr:OstA-like protein [Bacteroidaceae bacterium]